MTRTHWSTAGIANTAFRPLRVLALVLFAGLASGGLMAQGGERYGPPISTTDVSPDAPPGAAGNPNTGGRIVSIVMNPRNQLVLYAASEMAGVWKSVNGGGQWTESNVGLRNGVSYQHRQALALDDQNPDRLVYLSQDDDGRVGRPAGGLWATVDGGATWFHVDLPCVPASLAGAVFAKGQPFVITNCGVMTSTDLSLSSGTWAPLQQQPFPSFHSALASLGGSLSLFACQGAQVFRSLSQGAPGSWASGTIPGSCLALAVTPDNDRKVIVLHTEQVTGRMSTVILDLDASPGSQIERFGPTVLPLGCGGSFGSGAAAVYAARRSDIPPNFGPTRSYEVFVADGCQFYEFKLDRDPGLGDWRAIANVHDDTWAMAITPDYDPEFARCAAYLSTDGGVFAHLIGCDLSTNWRGLMSGLHVMSSQTMAGVRQPQRNCPDPRGPCPALYLPTGDNDVWVSATGGIPGDSWRYLGTNLGEAAIVLADPAQPTQVLASRGGGNQQFQLLQSADGRPPTVGSSMTDIQPPRPSAGGAPPAMANLVEIMTMRGEAAAQVGDYLAVSYGAGPLNDMIVRNLAGARGGWQDMSPGDQFAPGVVAGIGAANGHARPVVYVLVSPNAAFGQASGFKDPGSIWKGEIVNGVVARWANASTGISKAYNLYVDPYDANVLYVSDLEDGAIKVSEDGGATWRVDRVLTNLATNFGEFEFTCGQPARGDGPQRTSIFAFGCPLQSMVFDRENPKLRIAALTPGGVAISRDSGRHWLPLLVTNNGPFDNGPPEFPFSLFYDTTLNPSTGHPSLYVALAGKSVKRVDGPLLSATSGDIAICRICASGIFGPRPKKISIVLDSPQGGFALRADAHGNFRGSFLLDPQATPSIAYHFDVDGRQSPGQVHHISADERRDGVFRIRGDLTGCGFNRFLVWLHDVFDPDR